MVRSTDRLRTWQFCYGVSQIPAHGDKWFCARCAAGDEDAQCVLCPMPGGALKPVLNEPRSNKYCVRAVAVYVLARCMCATLSCMCICVCVNMQTARNVKAAGERCKTQEPRVLTWGNARQGEQHQKRVEPRVVRVVCARRHVWR